MSRERLDNQRRRVLKLAASSVAAVPLSSLLLHGQAKAGGLRRTQPSEAVSPIAAKRSNTRWYGIKATP